MNINDIINHDDLNWDDDEKRFVALSAEEIDKILISYIKTNPESADSIDELHRAVHWATSARCDEILLKNVLKGTVSFSFKGDEPVFCKVNNDD